MAELLRTTEIYLNLLKSQQVAADGKSIAATNRLVLYRGNTTIIRAHLYLEDTTYYKPNTNLEWLFILDADYALTNPVVSQHSVFNNVADWADRDVANGKVCWQVDTNTTQLLDDMQEEARLDGAKAELWLGVGGGETPTLLCQWDVDMINIMADVDGDTTDLVYALSNVVFFDGNDTVLLFPDGSVAQRWSK